MKARFKYNHLLSFTIDSLSDIRVNRLHSQ